MGIMGLTIALAMKLIRAPDDLVNKLRDASKRQGKTLQDYVTHIFKEAIKANETRMIDKEQKERRQPDQVFEIFDSKLNALADEKMRETVMERERLITFLSELSRADGEK